MDDDWEHDKNDTVASNDPWAFRHADQTSQEGLEFLKNEEGGFKQYPYNDSDDPSLANCTVGYGIKLHNGACTDHEWGTYTNPFTGKPFFVDRQDGMSEAYAFALMVDYIRTVVEPAIRDNINTSLTQYQYDALVSFLYNVGPGFLKPFLKDYLNARDFNSLENYIRATNLDNYNNPSDSIKRRREREIKLFLKGVYVNEQNEAQ